VEGLHLQCSTRLLAGFEGAASQQRKEGERKGRREKRKKEKDGGREGGEIRKVSGKGASLGISGSGTH